MCCGHILLKLKRWRSIFRLCNSRNRDLYRQISQRVPNSILRVTQPFLVNIFRGFSAALYHLLKVNTLQTLITLLHNGTWQWTASARRYFVYRESNTSSKITRRSPCIALRRMHLVSFEDIFLKYWLMYYLILNITKSDIWQDWSRMNPSISY